MDDYLDDVTGKYYELKDKIKRFPMPPFSDDEKIRIDKILDEIIRGSHNPSDVSPSKASDVNAPDPIARDNSHANTNHPMVVDTVQAPMAVITRSDTAPHSTKDQWKQLFEAKKAN